MTHSIDLKNNRQDTSPIRIGNYAFVGARCTILKGAILPDYSVLGACSLLNKQYNTPGLYAGNPAKYIKSLENYKYFEREYGFVKYLYYAQYFANNTSFRLAQCECRWSGVEHEPDTKRT